MKGSDTIIQALLDIKEGQGRIEQKVDDVKDSLTDHIHQTDEFRDDHEKRIRCLEKENDKRSWIQKHPLASKITIGSISLGTLIGVLGVVFKFVFELF